MQMDRVHAHAFLRVGLPMFRKLRRRISYTQVVFGSNANH